MKFGKTCPIKSVVVFSFEVVVVAVVVLVLVVVDVDWQPAASTNRLPYRIE